MPPAVAAPDASRDTALLEVLNGAGAALLFGALTIQLVGGAPLPWVVFSWLAAGIVFGLVVAMDRLDLTEGVWEDAPIERTVLMFFSAFFAVGFGGYLFLGVAGSGSQPPSGGVPPGYDPGPPWWFWLLIVGIAVAVAAAVYLGFRRAGFDMPPRRFLAARGASGSVGILSGIGAAWATAQVVGAGTLRSERVLTVLALVGAVLIGVVGRALPNPMSPRSARLWATVLAVGSAGLLLAGLAGLVPLTFEAPVVAALLGSLAMGTVGTIRYARHREGSGSRPAEAE